MKTSVKIGVVLLASDRLLRRMEWVKAEALWSETPKDGVLGLTTLTGSSKIAPSTLTIHSCSSILRQKLNVSPMNVYLMLDLWSFTTCDFKTAKLVGNPTRGKWGGFDGPVPNRRPYYFACLLAMATTALPVSPSS
ncbi:hypothetical protein K1719_047056 [Acacia pycnantha]|nr:hypothetical protein K1719_047056 [Acacia pycnantha]